MRLPHAYPLVLALLLAGTPTLAATNHGAPMPPGEAMPVTEALAQAERLAGQTVKLQGRITEVCQKTGCWVALDANGTPVRVHTHHVFFVPKDSAGQALVHGTWEAVPAEPDAPADAPTQWRVNATAITIKP